MGIQAFKDAKSGIEDSKAAQEKRAMMASLNKAKNNYEDVISISKAAQAQEKQTMLGSLNMAKNNYEDVITISQAAQADSFIQIAALKKLALIPEHANGANDINLLEVHSKLFVAASRIFSVHPDATKLMQQDFEEEEKGGPKYTFQGNAIIASLETLLANFKKMKANLDTEEADSLSAFEKKRLGNSNEIKFDSKEKSFKTKSEASISEQLSDDTISKGDETEDKTADERFLAAMTTDCEEKAASFDQRSSTRSAELVAM